MTKSSNLNDTQILPCMKEWYTCFRATFVIYSKHSYHYQFHTKWHSMIYQTKIFLWNDASEFIAGDMISPFLALKAWWRHQMETFSVKLTICAGNSPVTGKSCTKANDAELRCFSLICAWLNGWVNNRETGDLRRHRAYYDATIMVPLEFVICCRPCCKFQLVI